MPIIELKDKGIEVEFPDSMSQEEIKAIIQKQFYSQPQRQAVSTQEQPKKEQSGLMSTLARPFKAQTLKAASALNAGVETFSTNLDKLSKYFSEKTGLSYGGGFKKAAEFYAQNKDYWDAKVKEVGAGKVDELIGEAVGGSVPGIAEFMLNVPYSAALGAAEAKKQGKSEIAGAFKEGTKRGVLGAILHPVNKFNRGLRSVATGGVFGVQAATEGGDVAESVGTGILYGLAGPSGGVGLRDLGPKKAKPVIPTTPASAAFKEQFQNGDITLYEVKELRSKTGADNPLSAVLDEIITENAPRVHENISAGMDAAKKKSYQGPTPIIGEQPKTEKPRLFGMNRAETARKKPGFLRTAEDIAALKESEQSMNERDAGLILPEVEATPRESVSYPKKRLFQTRKGTGEPRTPGQMQGEVQVEYRPVITRAGQPFQTEAGARKAIKKQGLDTETHEVIPYNGGFAIQEKGRTIGAEEVKAEQPPISPDQPVSAGGESVPETIGDKVISVEPKGPERKLASSSKITPEQKEIWRKAHDIYKEADAKIANDLRKEYGKNLRLTGKSENGSDVILTPSARSEGKHQFTFFTKDGIPAGHEEYTTPQEGIKAFMEWTRISRPDLHDDFLLSPEAPREYVYESRLRPLGPGAAPKENLIGYENGGKFGRAVYSFPLTEEQIDHFSFTPIESREPKHPEYVHKTGLLTKNEQTKTPQAKAEPPTLQPTAKEASGGDAVKEKEPWEMSADERKKDGWIEVWRQDRADAPENDFREGSHWGTREQAEAIAQRENEAGRNIGKLHHAYIRVKNPLATYDGGFWEKPIKEAKEKGHDTVVYKNEGEGVGGKSYIPLSKDQIRTVPESVLKDYPDLAIKKSVTSKEGPGEKTTEATPKPDGGIDTKGFKAWFNGSKAVGENGNPITVYHGTSSDFDVFDLSMGGKNFGDEASKIGVFFSEARDDALRFGDKVKSYYLSIKNPYKINDNIIDEFRGKWLDDLEQRDPEEYEFQIETRKYLNDNGIDKGLEQAILYAKSENYDGAIIKSEGLSKPWYVVFSSDQVKPSFNQSRPSEMGGKPTVNQSLTVEKKSHGWAWINEQQRPFTEWKEIVRGKNKGKVAVTVAGKKHIIEKGKVRAWPEAPLDKQISDVNILLDEKTASTRESLKKDHPDWSAQRVEEELTRTVRAGEAAGISEAEAGAGKAVKKRLFDKKAVGQSEEIVTDPSRVQEIRNSIVEGEIAAVQRSVDKAKAKIGEAPSKISDRAKKLFSESKNRIKKRDETVQKYKDYSAVTLQKKLDDGTLTTVIHKSTKQAGKWQASRLDKKGEPWGDTTYESMEEALKDNLLDGGEVISAIPDKKKGNVTYSQFKTSIIEAIDNAPEINPKDAEGLRRVRIDGELGRAINKKGKQYSTYKSDTQLTKEMKQKYGTVQIQSPNYPNRTYNIINTKYHLNNFKTTMDGLEKKKGGITLASGLGALQPAYEKAATKLSAFLSESMAKSKIPFVSHIRYEDARKAMDEALTGEEKLAKTLDGLGIKGDRRTQFIAKITGAMGENKKLKDLTPEEKTLIGYALANIQTDPYGKAMIADIEDYRGIRLGKDFVNNAPDLRDLPDGLGQVLQMYRAADYVDPSGFLWKEVAMPMRDAEHNVRIEDKDIKKAVRDIVGRVSRGSLRSAQLQDFCEGKINLDQIPQAWHKKFDLFKKYTEAKYANFLSRVNDARAMAGKEAIKKRADYFTHGVELKYMDSFFGGMHNVPNEMVSASKHTHPNSPFFKYMERLGGEYKADAIGNFFDYSSNALKVIHMTPVIIKTRAYARHLPPNALKYFMEWADEVGAGKKSPYDKMVEELPMGRPFLKGWSWLRRRWQRNIVVGTARMSAQQLGSLSTTFSGIMTGEKSRGWTDTASNFYDFLIGHVGALNEHNRIALEGSQEYRDRIFVEDSDNSTIERVEDALNFATKRLDRFMYGGAYLSKYRQLSRHGVPHSEAAIEADKFAMKTQASYVKSMLPPVMRSELVKNVLPLQTFTFNMMNHAGIDVTGAIKQHGKMQTFKWGLTLMASMAAMNAVYEMLHMREVWDWSSFVPGAGYLKYDSSGPLGMTYGVAKHAISGEEKDLKKDAEKLAWQVVPPFGGEQIRKSIDGYLTVQDPTRKPYKFDSDFERLMAVIFGPGSTQAGREYWDKRKPSAEQRMLQKITGEKPGHERRQRRQRRERKRRGE